jgi:Resolvase, N terminal domain
MDRPGFNRMMEAIQAGQVKTVCVWRLDRLGRTCKGLVTLFDFLREVRGQPDLRRRGAAEPMGPILCPAPGTPTAHLPTDRVGRRTDGSRSAHGHAHWRRWTLTVTVNWPLPTL